MQQVIRAVPASEGAGVRINRAIGIPQLRNLDPFLMLDYFDSDRPDDYLAGFPDHPHRGFITFTYMLEGRMEHQDSMGHRGVIGPGDAQWMKAASGVIHSEMPRQIEGRMAGFQLWINLPARQKMTPPEYQEIGHERFPVVQDPGARIKVVTGEFRGTEAPIQDPNTRVNYLDIAVDAGESLHVQVPDGHQGFAFGYQGRGSVADQPLGARELLVLEPGNWTIATNGEAYHLIVVSGRPIGEPIVQMGPFVMNTEAEISQALRDYRSGQLVRPVRG
ncbi:MAG: pirin family protein [Xanthomonadales bacterium]|nr:pirin family protein [Xanthomonadales bacterium]